MQNILAKGRLLKFCAWMIFLIISVCTSFVQANDIVDKWEEQIREELMHDPRKAKVLSDSLLKYGSELNDDEILARSYYLLGVCHYYLSRTYISNEYYKKALKTYYAAGNDEFQGKCWNNMGINYDLMDKNAESMNAYLKSLRVSEKLKDSVGIAQSWINLGLLDTKYMRFERADKYLNDALKYFTKHNDTLNIGLCYQNLAVSFYDQKKIENALAFYKKSLEVFKSIDYKYGITQNYFNIGLQYVYLRESSKANLYLDSAIAIGKEIELDRLLPNMYMNKANLISDNSEKKLYYFNLAKESFLKLGNNESSMYLDLEMCDLFATNGDLKNYKKTIHEYRDKLNDLLKQKNLDRYEEFQAIYESEAKQDLIADQARKLEKRRNLLIGAGFVILLLVLFIVVVAFLLLKNKQYIVALYKKNLDIKNADTFAIPEDKVEELIDPEFVETDMQHPAEESSSRFIDLYNDIVRAFEEEKLFQRHDLSVSELSARFNTNDKYISLAIKNHRSGNFNAFVNAYRINETRKLIAEFGKSISIKELADKVGYKSLNTFYKNFKDITGLTPSQYIELSEDEAIN